MLFGCKRYDHLMNVFFVQVRIWLSSFTHPLSQRSIAARANDSPPSPLSPTHLITGRWGVTRCVTPRCLPTHSIWWRVTQNDATHRATTESRQTSIIVECIMCVCLVCVYLSVWPYFYLSIYVWTREGHHINRLLVRDRVHPMKRRESQH